MKEKMFLVPVHRVQNIKFHAGFIFRKDRTEKILHLGSYHYYKIEND